MSCWISRSLLDALMDAAEAAGEAEICGLLVGGDGRIEAAFPAPNRAADPRRGFEIDPAAHIAVQRKARAAGRKVIGHYHSHPSGSPRPSAADEALTGVEGRLWLILAGREAGLHVERQGRLAPVPLEISEAPPCNADGERPIGSGD